MILDLCSFLCIRKTRPCEVAVGILLVVTQLVRAHLVFDSGNKLTDKESAVPMHVHAQFELMEEESTTNRKRSIFKRLDITNHLITYHQEHRSDY